MKRTGPIASWSANEVGVEAEQNEKICALCGEDCSSRPRTRDPKGRYFCTACYRNAHVKPSPGDSGDTASLTSTGTAELDLLDKAIAEESEAPPCHGCGAERDPSSVVCTHCGLNVQTGRFEVSLTGGTLVTRIKTARGPSRWDRVIAHNRREASKAAFWHLVVPLAMLIAGFSVMTGLILLPGVEFTTQTLGRYSFTLAVELVLGVAVLWGAAALWLGGAGPLPLALLRVAGVFAVSDALTVLLAPLIAHAPISGVEWIVHGGILLTLLGWQFDLNLRDALLLGLPSFALKVGTALVLGAMLA